MSENDIIFTIEAEKKDAQRPQYRTKTVKISLQGSIDGDALAAKIDDLSQFAATKVKDVLKELGEEVTE